MKILPFQHTGYIGRNIKLHCLCAEDAVTVWYKDNQEINEDDEHYQYYSCEGDNTLEIASPELSDIGKYTCKIIKFGKEGESETSCFLTIIGIFKVKGGVQIQFLNVSLDFPHKFVKRLPPKLDLIERSVLALEVITEEDFASIKWYKDEEEIKITRKRNQRLKILSKDCHHILAIEKCVGSDRGVYKVSTNTETSVCDVNVTGKNKMFCSLLESTIYKMPFKRILVTFQVL